ncbi:unnamed protein product [Camellia sinensis]
MSCSLSFQIPKALPSLCQSHCKVPSVSIHSKQKQSHNPKPNKEPTTITGKLISYFNPKKSCLAIQVGALLGTVVQLPAYAVTGVNDEEDIIWVLIQLAISAFFYFLVAPAHYNELAEDQMVQEKSVGDVFSVHVCLLVLSRM